MSKDTETNTPIPPIQRSEIISASALRIVSLIWPDEDRANRAGWFEFSILTRGSADTEWRQRIVRFHRREIDRIQAVKLDADA